MRKLMSNFTAIVVSMCLGAGVFLYYPEVAVAEETAGPSSKPQGSETVETQSTEGAEPESTENLEAEEIEAALAQSVESTQPLGTAHVIETNDYQAMAVALPTLSQGDTQQIVFIASEDVTTLDSATLTLKGGDSTFAVEASVIDENAASFEFGENLAAGSYQVVNVEYVAGDNKFFVDFSNDEIDFEVVSGDAGTTTVYYMGESGELEQTDSIGEALATVTGTDGEFSLESLADEAEFYPIIALDAGHGGYDVGATGNGLKESDLTWKIASACKAKLDAAGYQTFMVRNEYGNYTGSDYLYRVQRAIDAGCNVYVSFHINSAEATSATGVEVWMPARENTLGAQLSYELSDKVLEKLSALGWVNRGRRYTSALAVINGSYNAGMPGILIEHGFISNPVDAAMLNDNGCKAMGEADAAAIIEQFPLPSEENFSAIYNYDYYVAHNSDVAAAFGGDRAQTFQHFLQYGMNEGRVASAGFDVLSYYNQYAELRADYGQNLVRYYIDYLRRGKDAGRAGTGCSTLRDWRTEFSGTDYAKVYDGKWYFDHYSDLQNAFTVYFNGRGFIDDTALLEHFVNYGISEGRQSSAKFNASTMQIMYRIYNQWSGEHLFTTSAEERDTLVDLGWSNEDIGWAAPKSGADGDKVYRLYNPWTSDHMFTQNAVEYQMLEDDGWTGEGFAFYTSGTGGQAIYRLFNPWLTAGTHFFTTDKSEYNTLGSIGWSQENIGFYGEAL